MKILHTIYNLSSGGAERQLSYLAPELARRGHEVHIAYVRGEGQPPVDENVHFHFLASVSNYDPRIILQLIKLTRRIKPDLIHSWILQADICSAIVGKLTRTKWVFREPDATILRNRVPFKFRVRQELARWANAIVANSVTGLAYWRNIYPSKLLRVIRNGYPVNEILSANSNVSRSSSHEKRAYEKRLLYVGRLSPEKNISALLDAVCYLDSNVTLIVCGSGPCENAIRNKVKKLDIQGRVDLLGTVDKEEVWGIMEKADAFALVSHFEGFPNVIIEAMLKRCPIIASDILTHRELLDDKTAYLVDRHDAIAISKAIKNAMCLSNKRANIVDSAFKLASTFTIANMVNQYESIYYDILSNDEHAEAKKLW